MSESTAKPVGPAVSIDHLAIAVDDLEASIDLYCSALGLKVLERRRTEGKKSSMVSAVLEGAGIPIVLVQGCEAESQVSRFVEHKGTGVQHIAFRVERLEPGIAQLADRGIEPAVPIIEGEGIRQVFMSADDRTGARLELIERNGGTFNEQSVRQLYLAFEDRDLY